MWRCWGWSWCWTRPRAMPSCARERESTTKRTRPAAPGGAPPALLPGQPAAGPAAQEAGRVRCRRRPGGGGTRLVLSRDEMVELVRVFLPDASNEARLMDQVDSHINKVVELGFLRRMKPPGRAAVRLRGAAHPQGLRRCPVAGRFRRAAGGLSGTARGNLMVTIDDA